MAGRLLPTQMAIAAVGLNLTGFNETWWSKRLNLYKPSKLLHKTYLHSKH